MFYRRRLLLALLQTLEGPIGLRDFQKQLFLFTGEQPSPAYDFVPYKYGCYSFTAEADRQALIRSGILRHSQEWAWVRERPDEDYSQLLFPEDWSLLVRHRNQFGDLRGHRLVRQTYLNAPYYASRSEIAREHLSEEEIKAIRKPPPQGGPALFTIGYEGKSLEYFLCQLLDSGVHVLCDVRRNPVSRKPGFSGSKLSDALRGLDIEYAHYPRLGIPSSMRRDLETAQDYQRLWADYTQVTLKENGSDIEAVLGLLSRGKRIALTCVERDPRQCHRSILAKNLKGRFECQRTHSLNLRNL